MGRADSSRARPRSRAPTLARESWTPVEGPVAGWRSPEPVEAWRRMSVRGDRGCVSVPSPRSQPQKRRQRVSRKKILTIAARGEGEVRGGGPTSIPSRRSRVAAQPLRQLGAITGERRLEFNDGARTWCLAPKAARNGAWPVVPGVRHGHAARTRPGSSASTSSAGRKLFIAYFDLAVNDFDHHSTRWRQLRPGAGLPSPTRYPEQYRTHRATASQSRSPIRWAWAAAG